MTDFADDLNFGVSLDVPPKNNSNPTFAKPSEAPSAMSGAS